MELILAQINETGQISRNWCLKNYITRLGSRIWDLKQDGYEFSIKKEGGDYIYVLKRDPHKEPRQLSLV